ncbi:MAG: beta-ketoacyl-ACP synthase II [Bacteroidales bacterium]|nr:beta-ketoacyl-ACP synthase II [Bacteroidales bacterium]MDY6405581.1 beta-ketoacyl-ACP synthase II [Bacteroidales bacterium]
MQLKRVVITGLGALTPVGNSAPETWRALVNGENGIAPITAFDASQYKTQFAGEVKGFDPTTVIDKKEVRRMDRYAQFSVCVADEALRDSGLDLKKENRSRVGVIWGSGMGGLLTTEEQIIDFAKGNGVPRFNPFMIPKAIPSIAAGHISIRFGLGGLSFSVSTACSSSSHAVASAFDQIRLGHADVLLTGGADADVTFSGIGGFSSMHALSTNNEHPETASRPFSKSRDGFVLGEGAACLILEEYEHAKARGAKIYAEMVGEGMTSDAYHLTAPDPDGKGAERVMRLAIKDAGLQPEDIDYINTHGTSTPLGDVTELKAIQRVFGDHVYDMNLDSTKSMTGHLIGATGAVEAMACVMALKDGIIPPTINHDPEDLDENIDYRINFTFDKAQKRDIRYALSNTFGFGGHNACLLFKKWEE